MNRQDLVNSILPLVAGMRKYHRHEVVGLERIPKKGSAIIVVNHSLATYDIVLLLSTIYTELHRLPRPLIDRTFFKFPGLGELCNLFGAVQGSQESALRLLARDELITVAPGGMRESLRPMTQRYQIRWDRRKGFARLAMLSGAPVVLAACPKADDMYDVYPSKFTAWVYRQFRLPAPIARGLGLSPIPKPVKLVHYLSKPIKPPPMPDDPEEAKEAIAAFHAKLITNMEKLIGKAIQDKDHLD